MKIKTKATGVYYRDTQKGERIYYITYRLNGKAKEEKVGSSKEGVTIQYASKIRAKRISIDRLKDDAPMAQNKKLPTFEESFNKYYNKIEGKSDAKNTKGRYINHLKDTFGSLTLDEITVQAVEEYMQKATKKINKKSGKPYAAKTINDWIDLISTVFNYMISNHDLNIKNPADAKKIEREKVDNDRERYLELEEIEKLWEVLEERVGPKYKAYVTENMKVFLALSLSTGARLGSVLTISKADVNLKHNTITIKNHKANRTYTGFIHPKYRGLIEDRMKKCKAIEYLVNISPKPLSGNALSKVFKKIFDENFNVGIDEDDIKRRAVIHTFRHTFASQLAIQSTPIYTIMRLMDHSDISQTIRYAKLSPDSAKDSVFELKI